MENKMSIYGKFYKLLDNCIKPILDKKIIIYGCEGGDFLRWFCKQYYNKEIKAVVDRWALSPVSTVLHLWSFYYIYEDKDIIINTTPQNIEEEFNDTGEDWNRVKYKKEQIINLWDIVYTECRKEKLDENYPKLTYFDWLEYTYGVELLSTVNRKFTTGEYAHGYFPTDFRIFVEGICKCNITNEDAILDIGCGKGSGVLALEACGFETIGAVEYTESIYKILIANLQKMKIPFVDFQREGSHKNGGVTCYLADASKLVQQLDDYNWFFLFNPFSWHIVWIVLQNICDSYIRKPRKLHIFYAEPIGHDLIMKTGMFRVKERVCSSLSKVSYFSYIYESL